MSRGVLLLRGSEIPIRNCGLPLFTLLILQIFLVRLGLLENQNSRQSSHLPSSP